ncbi:hypothetical protein [Lacinutrix sp. Bg11-31]|uniref:hypothetical protein n=1 Tax=Lacinutrix sp. Bg11-31 TaxID=2057808 RepID=UPI000C304B3A|nr:hypothetical protein [Lacinutrix sp. Bg11-31]AUC82915.1 hypothetical protein CW733_12595 [Lacinutrix sp. Bg11-31]
MRLFYYFFLILFFVSCSSNDSVVQKQSTTEGNNLKITYRGYYQVYFDEPYQSNTYKNITITPITEQISSTETINLLKVNAYSGNSTEDYISFKVLTNTIGNNVLFNNEFLFQSHGAAYFPSNFNLEVLKNNDIEFKANFSGELEHWYQGELRHVYLDVTSASIYILH